MEYKEFVEHCKEHKEDIIKAIFSVRHIKENQPMLSSVTNNGFISTLLDFSIAGAIGGEYVDKQGYDIDMDGLKISSKSLNKMFTQKLETYSIIDSNKIASSENYSDEKHLENCYKDAYLLIQKEDPISIAVCKADNVKQFLVEKKSNVNLKITDSNLLDFIVLPSENIKYNCNFQPTSGILKIEEGFNEIIAINKGK